MDSFTRRHAQKDIALLMVRQGLYNNTYGLFVHVQTRAIALFISHIHQSKKIVSNYSWPSATSVQVPIFLQWTDCGVSVNPRSSPILPPFTYRCLTYQGLWPPAHPPQRALCTRRHRRVRNGVPEHWQARPCSGSEKRLSEEPSRHYFAPPFRGQGCDAMLRPS
jgi:hypothetical protein